VTEEAANNRGGRREGAGRKPNAEKGQPVKVRVEVYVEPDLAATIKRLGGSEWCAIALRIAAEWTERQESGEGG